MVSAFPFFLYSQHKEIDMSLLDIEHLEKTYASRIGGKNVKAIRDISFSVQPGEYVAIMGESGAGKTTLLNLLAAIDKPTAGSILLDGIDLRGIKEKELAAFRREHLGFVFQEFNLLDTFNVQDNILLPMVLAGAKYEEMMKRLKPFAARLGIGDLLKKYPYQISGGQRQRAAVARAMITNPSLLLADEPTGALDSKSTDELLSLFEELNDQGQTIVMVTHSIKAASSANRVLFIKDGKLFHQLYKEDQSSQKFYQQISDTLTLLASGEGQ